MLNQVQHDKGVCIMENNVLLSMRGIYKEFPGEAGITHGVNGKVIVMGFDCNTWALEELLKGNWNYDGQCSPFQAAIIENMIKTGIMTKKFINQEKGFDAKTITKADVEKYGI